MKNKKTCEIAMQYWYILGKVWTFWEAHKNLRNLPHALDLVNVQSMKKIFSNFVRFSESPNFNHFESA